MLHELLNNNLPDNIKRYLNWKSDETNTIVNAIETAWVQNTEGVSVPFYSDLVGDQNLSKIVYALSKEGWINSIVKTRFSQFSLSQRQLNQYVSTTDQTIYRMGIKAKRYRLRLVDDIQPSNLTASTNGAIDVGLDRPGFASCANTSFQFDTKMMYKYYDTLLININKSMEKVIVKHPGVTEDLANYKIIGNEILSYYLCNPSNKYNMERNLSDKRGRSIYGGLKRVFNPIASKDARSLLITTKSKFLLDTDTEPLADIYLFIAELVGTKAKTWSGKKLSGRISYSRRKLHTLDLANEDDRKDLHENIWLERMYDALDTLFTDGSIHWNIPLELDQTMSLAQISGILVNDKQLLNNTNVIHPNELLDAWHVEGVPRLHTKVVGTPTFYGSSEPAKSLLTKKELALTKEQIRKLEKEFNSGSFRVLKNLKNYFIKYANITTTVVDMSIWDEEFTVTVNKFKPVGSSLTAYTGYDSVKDKATMFMIHKPKLVPDYDRFKLFWPTCLIHNLDSRVMDKTMEALTSRGEWAISIHDAALVLPGSRMRTEFVKVLEDLRANRTRIIDNYLTSIGATSPAAKAAWMTLLAKTEQLADNIPFSTSCLK